ncbi:MAG TPA: transcription elongation factor GreA [Gemmatimonadales bacterium]
MIEQIRQKLTAEVEQLNHELNVVLPEALKKAIQQGDLRENGDYHAALERQQFVHARLNQLRSRLSKLSQIDLSKVPRDRVGLGSRVVVLDTGTKQRETFELVIPDAMDMDSGHVSVSSPLGRGLLDGKPGQTVTVRLPAGVRKLKIVELSTLHEQVENKAEGALS